MIPGGCDNFTLYRIEMKDSPNFHVACSGGNGFTVWGVVIDTPKAGRNTDGIDPGNSSNVANSHNHFYYGHGMSIGSETDGGADHIVVTDLSIDGADNGIRIKSNSTRGDLVENIRCEDVCIKDTKNPIFMDSNYSHMGTARDKLPQFRNIVLSNVRIDGGGRLTLDGYDATHPLGMMFDGVTLSSPNSIKIAAKFANLELGPGPVNFLATGEDVKITGKPGNGKPSSCEGKFVPMPTR
jgi:polygalacturonase